MSSSAGLNINLWDLHNPYHLAWDSSSLVDCHAISLFCILPEKECLPYRYVLFDYLVCLFFNPAELLISKALVMGYVKMGLFLCLLCSCLIYMPSKNPFCGCIDYMG